MAAPTSQYTRRHRITVLRADWGAPFNHPHELNDGYGSGYTPNQVTVDRVWVLVGGIEYALESGCVVAPTPTATNVVLFVGDALPGTAFRDFCCQKFGQQPTSVIVEVTVEFVHSVQLGTAALADETIGHPVAGRVPASLIGDGAYDPINTEIIYVDGATGADTYDGHSVATPYATAQRAWNDLMARGRFYHNVVIDQAAGTYAGTVSAEGVSFSGGAHFCWIGAVQGTALKTTTSGGAVQLIASGRDHMLIRILPDQAWAPGGPVAADIGRTLRISDGTFTCYATIAAVSISNVPGVDCYIDISINSAIMPAAPAWIPLAGTTFEIINEAAADVTILTGDVYLAGITSSVGNVNQARPDDTKFNLIGNIVHNTGTFILESCDRVAYHNTRFDNGVMIINAGGDAGSLANAVPGVGTAWYWPDTVWTRLGYTDGAGGTIAETANAWGGAGFYAAAATFRAGGYYGGMVTGARVSVLGDGNLSAFICCAIDDTGGESLRVHQGGAASNSRCRLTGQIRVQTRGTYVMNDYLSWLAAAGAVDDAPAAAQVDIDGAMIAVLSQGRFYAVATAARIEGVGSNAHATNFVLSAEGNSNVYWQGGNDANLFSHAGWLRASGGAQLFMDGDHVFPAKTAGGLGATLDIELDKASLVSAGNWTKVAEDTTPCGLASLRASKWHHGDPVTDAGQVVWGAHAAVVGFDSGAFPIIDVDDDSSLEIGNPYINKTDGGAVTINIGHRSYVHFGGDGTSFVELQGAAATAIQVGGAAPAIGGWTPGGAGTGLSDDIGAVLGTRQVCYYESE